MPVGIDIAEVSRFENLSERFLTRCYTKEERCLFDKKKGAETAAANFAAKEAFSKALGTGVRGFELSDVAVLRAENGKPYFKFAPNVDELLSRMCAKSVELSVSHDGGMAAAVVVINQQRHASAFLKAVEKTDTEDKSIISYNSVKKALPIRLLDTHKGDYGKVFVVAGSKGLTGAGIFASKSAVKAGAGLVTLGCCESLNSIFETSLYEVMTYPVKDNNGVISFESAKALTDKANKSDVLVLGCGLGNTEDVPKLVEYILKNVKVPVVIDADGINALSGNINVLRDVSVPVVLTPHIMEFSRISGMTIDEINADRAKAASDFAVKWGVTVVLKSHKTVVAEKNGSVSVNLLGNSGMSTGGTGDVLAGVIGSFIGQGVENPVKTAVYVHSLAADLAAEEKGEYGLTPSDIVEYIPYAIDYLVGKEDYLC